MVNAYTTTSELLEILQVEQKACMRGDRLSLSPASCGVGPFIDKFIESNGLQGFSAYKNFRQTIHEYQKANNISGIVWETVTLWGRSMRYPTIHEQLASLDSDLILLSQMKSPITVFWQQAVSGLDLFLGLQGSKVFERATLDDVARIYYRSQWVKLYHQSQDETLEIILELGWGKPEESFNHQGFPASGSDRIHAVLQGKHPLG